MVRLYQEAELGFDFLVGQSQCLEHLFLQLVIGDTNGTGGQFCAVQHQVKCLCSDTCRIAVQIGQALVHGHGERVVHCVPVLGVLVPFEERELGDPQEVELALRNQIQLLCHFQTECSQYRQGHLVLICHNENHVALGTVQTGQDLVQLALRQELCERAGRLLIVPANECQSLCTDALCLFGQLVDFLSCQHGSCIFCHDCPNAAAGFQCRTEYHKVYVLDCVRQILQFHAEAGIRLV